MRSSAGAMYAMQVLPDTARDPGFGIRPAQDSSPQEFNRVGREYRQIMQQRYGGDLAKMWAAYNAGPGRVDAAIRTHGARWLEALPAETQAYVRRNIAQARAS